METLQLLCLALGLSTLAGLRLYLTVFLTSLALHQNWLQLDPAYSSLEILGSDAVLIVSGVLPALEFLADKVAGFDSVWDTVHTAIRPVGATILALQVLGEWPAEAKVIAALCAGGVALTVHSAKAGARLLVNASPEPATNVLVSSAEDVAVAGLFALLVKYPVFSAFIFVAMIAFCAWATPRAFRMVRATLALLGQRLFRAPRPAFDLPRHLDPDHDMLASRAFDHDDLSVAWAVEALSSRPRRIRGLDANRRGVLVAFHEQPETIVFVARKLFRRSAIKLPLAGCHVTQQSTFLSENLALHHRQSGRRVVFRFPSAEAAIVSRLADDLRSRTGPPVRAIESVQVAGPVTAEA
jgi:hypothetical protein